MKDIRKLNHSTKRRRYIYFSILSLIYLLVYFHRVSPAIMIPELEKNFQVSATFLGFYASLYFYMYALFQIPVGYLADFWGVRKTISFFTFIAGIGCLLFSFSPNIICVLISRVIIGIGVAGVYIPTLRFLANWYKKEEFATMTGLLMGIGNLGAIIAATPLGISINKFGWRLTFGFIGILTFILCLNVFFYIKKGPFSYKKEQNNIVKPSLKDFKEIILTKQMLCLCLAMFGKYGPLMGIQGLWGIKFFNDMYGFSEVTGGNIIIFISIGYIVGCPLAAYLADKVVHSKKIVLISGTIMYLLGWIPFLMVLPLGANLWSIVSLILGMVGGGAAVLLFSIAKETFPHKYTGTAIAIVNMFVFIGAAVYQPVMSMILDNNKLLNGSFSLTGYRQVFIICIAGSILMLLCSCLLKEENN